MKKSKELKLAIILTICINIIFVCSVIYVAVSGWKSPQITIFITSLMFAYHCDIRIFVGYVFNRFIKNKICVQSPLFAIKEKEYKRLQKVGVKRWKDKFIAWNRSLFVLGKMDKDRLNIVLQNNITAEITHWVCFFVGFLAIPIGMILSSAEWWIYLSTALITSLVADLPPIFIQRYNRYRLQSISKQASQSTKTPIN